MTKYQELKSELTQRPQRWLVTGGTGFIGSHVVEQLLRLKQQVRVLDDLSTGYRRNIDAAQQEVGSAVELMAGDIRNPSQVQAAMAGVDRVVHLAAMGSVPLSMDEPARCHEINATGTLNVFLAAREAGVRQISYASSSAVYGDDARDFKVENSIGASLSPYAASKRINEIQAQYLHTCFGTRIVGLRFFNVFGPRQDPKGAYAAVIPQWVDAMKKGQDVFINGDGGNTRDFCFVRDVVQSLLLAATAEEEAPLGKVFNVGLGHATTLNELFAHLRTLVQEETGMSVPDVIYRDCRAGDIRHSCADVSCAQQVLGFTPEYKLHEGLRSTVASF